MNFVLYNITVVISRVNFGRKEKRSHGVNSGYTFIMYMSRSIRIKVDSSKTTKERTRDERRSTTIQ